jgi:hypothetical protein
VFARAVPLAKALGAAIVALGAAAVWGAVAAGIKLVSSLGTAFLVAWGKALLGPALIAAAVFLVILAVDELFTLMEGGDTIIGDWVGTWEELRKKLEPIVTVIRQVGDAIGNLVAGALMTPFALLTGDWELFVESIKAGWGGIKSIFGMLIKAFDFISGAIASGIKMIPGGIGNAVGIAAKRTGNAADCLAQGVQNVASIGGRIGSEALAHAQPRFTTPGNPLALSFQGAPINVNVMSGTTAGQAQDVGRAVEEAQRRANRDLAMEIKRRGAP